MKEIVDLWGRKVLLHICRFPFSTFLSRSVSLRVVCFRAKKHHEGDSQYRGVLTVGGHTVARITQRKVQIRSGWEQCSGVC